MVVNIKLTTICINIKFQISPEALLQGIHG